MMVKRRSWEGVLVLIFKEIMRENEQLLGKNGGYAICNTSILTDGVSNSCSKNHNDSYETSSNMRFPSVFLVSILQPVVNQREGFTDSLQVLQDILAVSTLHLEAGIPVDVLIFCFFWLGMGGQGQDEFLFFLHISKLYNHMSFFVVDVVHHVT